MVDDIIRYLDVLQKPLDGVGEIFIRNEEELTGVLTYIVFRLLRKYYGTGNWYTKMDAEKVCSSALDEFKRRFLHPYEDEAIKRNGDAE